MKLLHTKYFSIAYLVFCFTFLILIYHSASQSLLIDDGISGIWEIKQQGWEGYKNNFGFKNYYYGHYAVLYILYKLFGIQSWYWFLFFILMHAINSTMIYILSKRMFQWALSSKETFFVAIFGSLLFLLSPYQSENILWAATSHYALTLLILLISLNMMISFFIKQNWNQIILFHCLFVFSILTLEISFIFPFIYWVFYLALKQITKKDFSFYKQIIFPQLLIISVYFAIHYIQFHKGLPFDRTNQEIEFSFTQSIQMITMQIVKLFGFTSYLDYSTREIVYTSIKEIYPSILYALYFLIGALFLFYLYKKKKENFYLALFFIITIFCLYAPYFKQYFAYLFRYENDRYNYFSSAFLFPFFIFCLLFLPNIVRYAIAWSYLLVFVFLLPLIVKAHQQSGELHQIFLQQLKKYEHKEKIFLLNVPSFCRDFYNFRNTSRIGIAYQTLYEKNIFNKIATIAWYSAQTSNDEFVVEKKEENKFIITAKTNGVWWMHETNGAIDYENDLYYFTLGKNNTYEIQFKRQVKSTEALIIFSKSKMIAIDP